MATRPVFIPHTDKDRLVKEISVDFKWYSGMAVTQKQKSIASLHDAAKKRDIAPILEISSKSTDDFGKRLSAFKLKLNSSQHGMITVESAFQGSKVFMHGGPYTEFYYKNGWEIKKDPRIKEAGDLKMFLFEDVEWALEPKTAFYDWLYINALQDNKNLCKSLLKFNGFTDIEFNPKKSINCQARSCALYVSIVKKEMINDVLSDRDIFLDLLSKDACFQPHSTIGPLFQ